jgi:hypothetical protein
MPRIVELGYRRRTGRHGRPPAEPLEAALWLLREMIPDAPHRIAEELVWWRLNLAAPSQASLPPDAAEVEEGPLHHRFAVASHGFVPDAVLGLRIDPPSRPMDPHGEVDPVVGARAERDSELADAVSDALGVLVPDLTGASLTSAVAHLHALVEGVAVGVCLGRLAPEEAVAILRGQLECLTSGGSSPASP